MRYLLPSRSARMTTSRSCRIRLPTWHCGAKVPYEEYLTGYSNAWIISIMLDEKCARGGSGIFCSTNPSTENARKTATVSRSVRASARGCEKKQVAEASRQVFSQ